MNTIRAVVKKATSILNAIGAFLLVLCSVIVFSNVILRYFFSCPFRWTDELSVILLGWFVFLAQPALEQNNQQLRMTVMYNIFGQKTKKTINILRSLLTVFLSLYLTYWSFTVIKLNYVTNGTTMALGIPLWILYLIIPICLIMISIVRVFDLFVLEGDEQDVDSNNCVC